MSVNKFGGRARETPGHRSTVYTSHPVYPVVSPPSAGARHETRTTYLMMTDIQEGVAIPLNPVIDNDVGDMEIALSEILWYPAWINIGKEYDNNWFHYGGHGDEKVKIIIPDGLYDVCALSEQVFLPLKLKLSINHATARVTVRGLNDYFDLGGVGGILGFIDLVPSAPGGVVTGEVPHRLNALKEVCVRLEGLVTSGNQHNGFPSNILRIIPVKTEACYSGHAEAFPVLQWKRLERGTLSHIKLSVRDAGGKPVKMAYLSCLLEVRRTS